MTIFLLTIFLGATPSVNVLLAKQAKRYGRCGTMLHTIRTQGATLRTKTRLVSTHHCPRFKRWYRGFSEVTKSRDIARITIHRGLIVSQIVLWCRGGRRCVKSGRLRMRMVILLLHPKAKGLKKIRRELWKMIREK